MTEGRVQSPVRWHTDSRTCRHENDDVCPFCDFDGYYANTYPDCPWAKCRYCRSLIADTPSLAANHVPGVCDPCAANMYAEHEAQR